MDAAPDCGSQVELSVAAVVAQNVRDVAAEAPEHAEPGEQPITLTRHRSTTRPISARKKRSPLPLPLWLPGAPYRHAPACAAERGSRDTTGSGTG